MHTQFLGFVYTRTQSMPGFDEQSLRFEPRSHQKQLLDMRQAPFPGANGDAQQFGCMMVSF